MKNIITKPFSAKRYTGNDVDTGHGYGWVDITSEALAQVERLNSLSRIVCFHVTHHQTRNKGSNIMLPIRVFTCDGYDFYVDASGRWNVARAGDRPPTNCAYASPEAITKLKNCNLRSGIVWRKSND